MTEAVAPDAGWAWATAQNHRPRADDAGAVTLGPVIPRPASPDAVPDPTHRRFRGRLAAVVYWLAVLIVSLAIAVGVIAYLVSRDEASVGAGRGNTVTATTP